MGGVKIKKGDKVQIIAGKDRGKKGKVLRVLPEKGRIVIQGVAKVTKNVKPTKSNPQAGKIETESPIHISNIMVICASCKQPSRIGSRTENDKRVRICKNCNEIIEVAK